MPRPLCHLVKLNPPQLIHHNIRVPLHWHKKHQLALQIWLRHRIKDQALPRLSTSSLRSCRLKSSGIWVWTLGPRLSRLTLFRLMFNTCSAFLFSFPLPCPLISDSSV